MRCESSVLCSNLAVLNQPNPKPACFRWHGHSQVKLFDFGGMDKRHLPFREIEPEEGNVVVSISYSGTGHAFLVCTAGSQPKVGNL